MFMLKKTVLLLCLVFITFGLENADAFLFQLDIGDTGQPVKAGWEEFTGNGNNESDPKTEIYNVGGLSISVSLQTGNINDSGYRDYGGGDLGGDMVYPDDENGPVDGRVILTLGDLPAGEYTLTSYHNDTKSSHAQKDPIDVSVAGAVSASTSDLGVVQTKCSDDNCLGSSTVTFTANGTGDVIITYTPTTDAGVVSKATLCGFELELTSTTTLVQFETESSSGAEDIGTAYLNVNLSSPEDVNTITVNYTVTGGTADGNDYTLNPGILTFAPLETSQQIEITIVNDGGGEDDETIEITLSSPTNAQLGTITQHTYTIEDMNPNIAFDMSASDGPENVSPVSVPVSLSKLWNEIVTVDYSVTGGTAEGNGVDYILEAGTLQFDPCDETEYIVINLVEDDFHEDPDETIEITLSDPAGGKLGSITQHTFTILPQMVTLCPRGDLDGDCDVDYNDVKLFAGQWLDPMGSCSGYDCANFDEIDNVDMIDFAILASNWREDVFAVVINEFMASNDETLEDPNESGEYPDWIELYNGSPLPVDLGGIYITDKLDNPTKCRIPDGLTIGPGEYLVFYADEDPEQSSMHLDLKLSASGEAVALFDTNGSTMIDSIEFGSQSSDISYGRYPDSSEFWRFFSTPTPGSQNEGAYLGEVADTKFSHDRGFYESAFNLSITCDTSNSNIYYTLDGSEPDESTGLLYTGPITNINQTTVLRAAAFKPGYLPSDVDSQTYIFLDDVIDQAGMDPVVVYNPSYSSIIKDALKSIPTISIVMDSDDFDNLQLQDSRDGTKEELATSIELIYADANDGEGFQINCGIEGHSWPASSEDNNKRSYRLLFKSEYGPSRLSFPQIRR